MTTASTSSRLRRSGLAALATALLAVAGCGGDPEPLEGLTPVQRDQLTTAWTAHIAATDATKLPDDERNARAAALYTACAPLDPTNPFLAAIAASCGPTAVSQKLSVVLPTRCSKPAAICVRALDRIAEATDQIAVLVEKIGTESARVIEDPACRRQFTTTEARTKAYGDLAAAYRIVALGVEQKDEDIAALGQRRIDDATAASKAPGTAAERTAAFRAACGIDER